MASKRSVEDDEESGSDEKRLKAEGVDAAQDSEALESPSAGGRHSGRVRKKSAKVLEMEEFEGLEKKAHTKSSGSKSVKKQAKAKSAISPVVEFPGVQTQGSPSALQNLLNSPTPAGVTALQQTPVAPIAPTLPVAINFSPPPSSPPAESLKLKLNLSAMAASQNPLVSPPGQLPPPPPSKSEKKAKAKASKKTKGAVDIVNPVGHAVAENSQMKQEVDPGIKLKLKIPPSKETPKSPLREQLAQSLQQLSPPTGQKIEEPKSKKKKSKKEAVNTPSPVVASAPELAAALSQPIVAPPSQGLDAAALGLDQLTDAPLLIEEEKKKPKKEPKTKAKTKSPKIKKAAAELISPDPAKQTAGAEEDAEFLVDSAAPQYSNLQEMALKVQTSSEKKAGKTTKKGGKKAAEESDKPKRKRGPTAYMMWCNAKRPEVVSNHPGIDFAEISRRLGELWHGVPEKEKSIWKRKAKRAANKASMITTGKAAAKAVPKSSLKKTGGTANKSTAAATPTATVMPAVRHGGVSAARAVQPKVHPEQIVNITPQFKPVSCNPIDVAAHLKLLGESLAIIGTRLQEHRGHIAVQGTLSVLLDSMLCALGPLTSLTNQVPELNGCPSHVHSSTLDNIAYYMPGIG